MEGNREGFSNEELLRLVEGCAAGDLVAALALRDAALTLGLSGLGARGLTTFVWSLSPRSRGPLMPPPSAATLAAAVRMAKGEEGGGILSAFGLRPAPWLALALAEERTVAS